MNQIFVSCEEGLQEPVWLSKIEDFAANVLEAAGYDGEEISILFCGDPMIKELNANYRNIDAPTDVLSFENGEEYTDEEGKIWFQAGDIAISVDTLPKNAEYFEVSQNEELKRLIIHQRENVMIFLCVKRRRRSREICMTGLFQTVVK